MWLFRPSTPIYDVLEHKYQDKWIQQRYVQSHAQRKAEQQVIITTQNNTFSIISFHLTSASFADALRELRHHLVLVLFARKLCVQFCNFFLITVLFTCVIFESAEI